MFKAFFYKTIKGIFNKVVYCNYKNRNFISLTSVDKCNIFKAITILIFKISIQIASNLRFMSQI